MTTGRDITWRRTILSAGALAALAVLFALAWRLAMLMALGEAHRGWWFPWKAWREYYLWIMLFGGIGFVAWVALSNRPLGRRRMIALLVSLSLAYAMMVQLGAAIMDARGGPTLIQPLIEPVWYGLPLLFLVPAWVAGLRPSAARLAMAMLVWLQGPVWGHAIGLLMEEGRHLLDSTWDGFYTPLPMLSFGLLFLPWPERKPKIGAGPARMLE